VELQADAVLLDPALTVGLPAALTAATGIDALVHAIEAATNRNRHPLASAPALQAITLVRAHLPRAIAAPDDLEARGGMLLAAWLAGQAIDRAGTGIAHALGHALGTLGKVHHGRAVGLALAVALAANAEVAPAAHVAVARAFGLRGDDEAVCAGLAGAYLEFMASVGLVRRLEGVSYDANALLAAVLAAENRPMREANCRRFDDGELRGLCAALLAA
jgi:alcohol dehydrogenase class IV